MYGARIHVPHLIVVVVPLFGGKNPSMCPRGCEPSLDVAANAGESPRDTLLREARGRTFPRSIPLFLCFTQPLLSSHMHRLFCLSSTQRYSTRFDGYTRQKSCTIY